MESISVHLTEMKGTEKLSHTFMGNSGGLHGPYWQHTAHISFMYVTWLNSIGNKAIGPGGQ